MSRKLSRAKPSLQIKPKIILACEGAKTERLYLNNIKQVHRLSSVEFEILPHEGTDPRTIVSQIAERIRRERNAKAWDSDRDRGWAIFDGDEHLQTAGQRNNWNAAIQQAESYGVNLAITNPSFEYWYLLHFQNRNSNISRHDAFTMLRSHFPSYDKNIPMYSILKSLTPEAIKRACDLRGAAERDGIGMYDNPCCWGISDLVAFLIRLP